MPNPAQRASASKKHVAKVRRSYKKNLKTRKKLLPVEEKHVATMVVILKLAGYTRSQMASIIGVSRGQIKEILEKPETLKLLETMRERLPQAALELLHGYSIEAVQAIVEVMRMSHEPKWILHAAESILDRVGIPKASRMERHSINENTVSADDFFERLRQAPPEIQERAAQMVEDLEKLLGEQTEDEDG